MKFRTKILLGHLTSFLLVLGLCAVVLSRINTMSPVADELNREVIVLGRVLSLSGLSGRIVFLRGELARTADEFVRTQDIGHELRYGRFSQELSEVFEQAIKESDTEEDRTIFSNLQDTSLKLEIMETEMINLTKAKKIEQAEAWAQSEDYVELKLAIADFVVALANKKQADSSDLFSRLIQVSATTQINREQLRDLINVTTASVVLVLIASVVVGIFIARSMSQSLTLLQEGAVAIGKGDLDHRIEYRRKDELGALAGSFNRMAEGLRSSAVLRDTLIQEVRVHNQALKASEAKYRDLYDNDPIMHATVDVETAVVLDCNQILATALDYTKEEVIGHSVFDVYHPDCMEDVKKTFRSLEETGQITDAELQLKRRDGSRIDVNLKVAAVRDKEGKLLSRSSWTDITERKQTEMKIQKVRKQLRALSRQLISTQETDRRRIALELHDELGQELALMSIEIEQLMQKPPESQAQLVKHLQKLAMKNRRISTYVQTLSHKLHPSSLEHLGFVAAARSLCHEVSKSSEIQIDFGHSDFPRSIPEDVSICLYRVLQESLTNIVKHSGTREAQVRLTGRSDEIHLYVCDLGIGFDPDSVGSDGGLGFVGMRERLSLVGGELLIESQPSVGTQIKVCVPLNSSASPD